MWNVKIRRKKARSSKNKFLRSIFGPKKNDQTGEYEIRSNNVIKNILVEEVIIPTLKGKKWVGWDTYRDRMA